MKKFVIYRKQQKEKNMSIEYENEKACEDFAARMRGEIPEEKQGRKVSSGDSVEDSRQSFAARMRGESVEDNESQQDESERRKQYDETPPVPFSFEGRDVLKEYRKQRAENGL